MITGIIEPSSLSRAELDRHLEAGWYRMGRSLITTDYLVSEGTIRSTVWTRLDLAGHRFRPSISRRLAKLTQRFRVEVGALCLDSSHEELYQRYRAHASGNRAEELDDVLGGDEGRSLFETAEVRIFDKDELVAFSWFDLGEISAQSLIGVYHPDYRRHSLGFCTMLLEIAHAASLGMRFHYSGYVLSEPSSMDYKKQVGELEYLDPKARKWVPAPPYPPGQSPAEILRLKLGEAARVIAEAGAEAHLQLNSALRFPGLRERIPECATAPLLLFCTSPEHPWGVLVTWEEAQSRYALWSGRPIAVPVSHEDGSEPTWIYLFIPHARLGYYDTADEVAFWARCFVESFAPAGV